VFNSSSCRIHKPFGKSENWTTNYGHAYRDTIEKPTQLLACSAQFALCFHSGAQPYPCTLDPGGPSATCQCTVGDQRNYTLITAILNYPVFLASVQKCGTDGSNCPNTDDAPVCKTLNHGVLIPGANIISTFDPDSTATLQTAIANGLPSDEVTVCPKAPYAACMTAPCQVNRGGSTATCDCPVFYGRFQLAGSGAQCSLGGDLVPSASYLPTLDDAPND
jgi:hypothetical protein